MQKEKKVSVLHSAMHYGMLLGLFWGFKYMFSVIGETVNVFQFFFVLLNAGTFLLIYIFFIKFRQSNPDKKNDTATGLIFVVAMCFFASLFESMAVLLHFQIIDPSFYISKFVPKFQGIIETLKYSPEMKEATLNIVSNKLFYIFSLFTSNTFLGLILGAIFSVIVDKQKNK